MSDESINVPETDELPDIRNELYASIRKSAAANDVLYEHLMCGVRDSLSLLHAQDIEDALTMTCVALGGRPLDTLLIVHEFLSNCKSIAKNRKSD